MWSNTRFARARVLFWKGPYREPTGNSGASHPDLLGDGCLQEPLLTEGHHLLVVSQALFSLGWTQSLPM